MHSPYNKLVQKGFARLLYGDFADDATAPRFAGDAQRWAGVPPAKTVGDREAEKCFVGLAKPDFEAKCAPSDTASRQVGNCYTAALYMNLLSLVSAKASSLIGARLLLFSYGSGAVATAFTLIGREPSGGSALALPPASPFTLERIATTAQLAERLTARTCSDLPTLTRVRARRHRNAARTHAQDRPTPEPCGGRRRVRWHNNGPAREAELAMPVTPCRVIEICHVSGARAARGAVRPGGVRDRCQPHHTHPLHTLFVYHCRPVNRPKVARDAVLTTRDQPRSTEIVGGVRAVRRRRRSGAGDLLPRCGRRAPPPHLLEEVSRRFATPGAPSHSLGLLLGGGSAQTMLSGDG